MSDAEMCIRDRDIAAKCGMELLEHMVRGERAYYILRK